MGRDRAPSEGLLVVVDSPVHRLPASAKLLALVAFVLVVVATPAGHWAAFAAYAVLVLAALATARVPPAVAARRMLVETPFVVFAVLMPFVATGARVDVAGLSLSRAGLVGGATLLAKATLGVAVAVLLASTTGARDMLAGLDRLRLPGALVAILSFMVRYVSVVTDDLHRMRVARESRAYTGGRAGHLRAVAAGAGALFVRSYERGERVQLAMLARGYNGRMPSLGELAAGPAGAQGAPRGQASVSAATAWVRCAVLPSAALVVLLLDALLSA